MGAALVPDERVDALAAVLNPKKWFMHPLMWWTCREWILTTERARHAFGRCSKR